jgi:hypothetical protein
MIIQPADVLLFYGDNTSFISRTISNITKSPFTHVALAVDSTHLIEANGFTKTKVRTIKMSDNFIVMRASYIPKETLAKVVQNALNKKGTGYDYLDIGELLIEYTTHLDLKGLLEVKNRYICSSLLDFSFQEAGIDLFPGVATGDIAPASFANCKYLDLVK